MKAPLPRQGKGGLLPDQAGSQACLGLISLGGASIRDAATPATAPWAVAGGIAGVLRLRIRWAEEVCFLKVINEAGQ